nr:hypothetical protein [Stappia indica]
MRKMLVGGMRGLAATVMALLVLTGPNAASGLNVFEAELGELARTQLQEIARSPVVIDAVRAQNLKTSAYSDARIAELDREWGEETDGDYSRPLIDTTMAREVSHHLRDVQTRSEGLFTEIILMDARGLNVGISRVTSDYWQGDEDKWKKTFLVGPESLHIGPLEEDLSTRTVQSQVSLPVVDPDTGKVIGALTFGVDVEEM